MKYLVNIKPLLVLLIVFCFSHFMHAQEHLTSYSNEEVSVQLNKKKGWSYRFGILHRNTFYTEDDFDFYGNFIELNHYTSKKISKNGKLSLGIRYRFQKIFNGEAHEEIRPVEQYNYTKSLTTGKLKFRIRLAQRFREKFTFRSRYMVTYQVPINSKKTTDFILNTEAVWELGKNELPSFGQRIASGFSFLVFGNGTLTLTAEYRYRNYTQAPYAEFHLNTGVNFQF